MLASEEVSIGDAIPYDPTYREVVALRRTYLEGCLSDLRSEYQEITDALSVCRGTGPCLALGALQARRDGCVAECVLAWRALDALTAAPR